MSFVWSNLHRSMQMAMDIVEAQLLIDLDRCPQAAPIVCSCSHVRCVLKPKQNGFAWAYNCRAQTRLATVFEPNWPMPERSTKSTPVIWIHTFATVVMWILPLLQASGYRSQIETAKSGDRQKHYAYIKNTFASKPRRDRQLQNSIKTNRSRLLISTKQNTSQNRKLADRADLNHIVHSIYLLSFYSVILNSHGTLPALVISQLEEFGCESKIPDQEYFPFFHSLPKNDLWQLPLREIPQIRALRRCLLKSSIHYAPCSLTYGVRNFGYSGGISAWMWTLYAIKYSDGSTDGQNSHQFLHDGKFGSHSGSFTCHCPTIGVHTQVFIKFILLIHIQGILSIPSSKHRSPHSTPGRSPSVASTLTRFSRTPAQSGSVALTLNRYSRTPGHSVRGSSA